MTEKMKSFVKGILMGLCSSHHQTAHWETVFEGPIYASWSSYGNSGGSSYIWREEDNVQNGFCQWDIVRVTGNGKVAIYLATGARHVSFGNRWFIDIYEPYEIDDGFDFYISCNNDDGELHAYTRKSGLQTLKIEKLSIIDKPFVMDRPHLYNGYKLPALPERDTTKYPHAAILYKWYGDRFPYCIFSNVPLESGSESATLDAEVIMYRYFGWLGSWETEAVEGSGRDILYDKDVDLGSILWSSYPFYWKDEGYGVELERDASDPIPVYE